MYGFFNGAFLSVDFALALEAMPDQNDAARWMAVWGVAGFIGTTVGPVVSAPLLFLWPGSTTLEGGQVSVPAQWAAPPLARGVTHGCAAG